MITFTMLSTKSYHRDLLGLIPTFFSETDPRSAAEQIHEAYVYGDGWHPLQGWKYTEDTGQIVYPGDPPLRHRNPPRQFAPSRDHPRLSLCLGCDCAGGWQLRSVED